MQSFRRLGTWSFLRTVIGAGDVSVNASRLLNPCGIDVANRRTAIHEAKNSHHRRTGVALRTRKPRSEGNTNQHFLDMKAVKVQGGNGGDGAITFLRLWANENAGPGGGDGGNGGHVIFQTSSDVSDLSHVQTALRAENGEKGFSREMCGKNAENLIVKVPIGTIVRSVNGTIVADLDREGTMFVAARGGAGGHGNAFFKSDLEQAPQICEYGALGENCQYLLELRSMANVGLIGFPNAGKSTLLRAISRARPKVAPYPFTTLKPHLGMVQYDDYQQIAVADLPGLIPDSHKNKGLGITFLKHAERCAALLFVLDVSLDEPWVHLGQLLFELEQFSIELRKRPMIVIANKIDLPSSEENLALLRENTDLPVIPISAKTGTNLSTLLSQIRVLYDNHLAKSSNGSDIAEIVET